LFPVVKEFSNNLLIGGNGSIISDKGIIQVREEISLNAFKRIKNLIHKYSLQFIVDDEWDYAANVNLDNKILKQLDSDRLAKKINLKDIRKVIKVILINVPSQHYECIKLELSSLSQYISIVEHKEENSIDITSKNINKYTTLTAILGKVPFVAFGNDNNDIELLNNASSAFFIGTKELSEQLKLKNVTVLDKNVKSITTSIDSLRRNRLKP